jgi:hypothetical protein
LVTARAATAKAADADKDFNATHMVRTDNRTSATPCVDGASPLSPAKGRSSGRPMVVHSFSSIGDFDRRALSDLADCSKSMTDR